jgi:putative heme-binding domain-containing protein
LKCYFYGPGERWQRGGVARVRIEKSPDGKYSFAEQAVADIPKLSDLAFGSNGDLYLAHHGISDYLYNPTKEKTGGFYKLSFDPNARPDPLTKRNINPGNFADNVLESGKQLFAYCACSACHNVDNSPELLGPNLMDVGSRLSRSEILEEIKAPSNIIKPSMIGIKITKTKGQVLLGRLISTNEEMVSLMLVGNHVEELPRVEILKAEEEPKKPQPEIA